MSVSELVQRASDVVGNRHKLGKAMGVPASQVYDWAEGRKPCSAADRARLAAFAKEDPLQELVRATLEKTEGTLRGEQLRAVLGKWCGQTGAASVTGLASMGSAIFGMAKLEPAWRKLHVLLCILC